MINFKTLAAGAALAVATLAAANADASLYVNVGDTSAYVSDWAIGSQYTNYAFIGTTFVGSWQVDQGPSWTTDPTAYSGLTAAALLFGGPASQYSISTNGTDPSLINDSAWVSTWGGACDGAFPCGTIVGQGFIGGGVPEPATWAIMLLGVAGIGGVMRRKQALAA